MSDARHDDREPRQTVMLPAPTAWPLVTAFGIALAFAGLVTSAAIAAVGIALLVIGTVGGAREVLPVERHETVAVAAAPPAPAPAEPLARPGEAQHRMRIPARIHPYSAGLWGGLAGGAAMAVVAVLYGVITQGSPWLPINLLAAVVLPSLASADLASLRAFHVAGFALACVIHLLVSVGVGLLYGVLMPMLPGPAGPWGVLLAPLLWSGFLRVTLDLINPTLSAHIDWPWFVASQMAFGAVAGLVLTRSEKVAVAQRLPLRERAGIEIGGAPPEGDTPESGDRP